MRLFNDTSLFTSRERETELYELEDATLLLIEGFFTKEEADRMYEKLLKETAWKKSQVILYGELHDTPRLTASYGDRDKIYSFSGNTMNTIPWTPDLVFIKERVEKEGRNY